MRISCLPNFLRPLIPCRRIDWMFPPGSFQEIPGAGSKVFHPLSFSSGKGLSPWPGNKRTPKDSGTPGISALSPLPPSSRLRSLPLCALNSQTPQIFSWRRKRRVSPAAEGFELCLSNLTHPPVRLVFSPPVKAVETFTHPLTHRVYLPTYWKQSRHGTRRHTLPDQNPRFPSTLISHHVPSKETHHLQSQLSPSFLKMFNGQTLLLD